MTGRILAGHAAARTLRALGCPWVAGVSGESFLPLLDGLRLEEVPFVSVTHEESATFLASAHARMTGSVAWAAVTRGPGASNALIGIHEAAQAGAPVVLLVGQVESGIRGRQAMQEMEVARVYASVAKATFEVMRPDQIAPSLAAAARKAVAGRPGPVVVVVPADYFFAEVPADPIPGPAPRTARPTLAPSAARELQGLIAGAERGLFVAGATFGGGQHAALLGRVAERTGFGVVGGHAFPDALPSSHRSWLGTSTIRGSAELKGTLHEADVIVLLDHWVGDRVTQSYMPLNARLAVLADQPEAAWDEYLEMPVYSGDVIAALEDLERMVLPDDPAVAERQRWVDARRRALEAERQAVLEAARRQPSEHPAVGFPDVVGVLDRTLPDDVTIVSDAGSFGDWFVRYLPFGGGRRYLGTLSGSMGFGVPAGIGVQLARPRSRTVVLTGDGSFLMTGTELATAVRMKLPLTVVVFRNGIWGSIAIHQDRHFRGHRFAVDLPEVSYAGLARALGASAVEVAGPDDLPSALADALAHDGPALVEIPTDPIGLTPAFFERPAAIAALRR